MGRWGHCTCVCACFFLESTQLGWGQQPAFYHRKGKSVIRTQMESASWDPQRGGKTIALCIWTTPLCKVVPQMVFPLNLVTARDEETALPPDAPRSSSPPRAALEKPYITQGCNPGGPQPLQRQRFCFQAWEPSKDSLHSAPSCLVF